MTAFGEIISTNKPVLIGFHTDCHYLSGELVANLQEISNLVGDKVKVVKIDSDKNEELIKKLNTSVPAYMIYFKGELVWRSEGVETKEMLLTELKKIW